MPIRSAILDLLGNMESTRQADSATQIEADPASRSGEGGASPSRFRKLGEWCEKSMESYHWVNARDVAIKSAAVIAGTVITGRFGVQIGAPVGLALSAAAEYVTNHLMHQQEGNEGMAKDILNLHERLSKCEKQLSRNDPIGPEPPG